MCTVSTSKPRKENYEVTRKVWEGCLWASTCPWRRAGDCDKRVGVRGKDRGRVERGMAGRKARGANRTRVRGKGKHRSWAVLQGARRRARISSLPRAAYRTATTIRSQGAFLLTFRDQTSKQSSSARFQYLSKAATYASTCPLMPYAFLV
ncbi:hypothetical protein PUN28_013593 [Cardiocondyla obscurior]|uniref:Uncharacterized protein n=1 Tax=Cardiocondyla obscurior TaxID=286306 RepID=A0AAW2F4B2_9HYME